MFDSLFLSEIPIHPDWYSFLEKETIELIREIEAKIKKDDFTPEPEKVLRFLTVPLKAAKVVIIGQDPYPQPGIATGRAFEVGNLKSWSQSFQNVSLKNILRAVYKAYAGQVISYGSLKEKLFTDFPVLPPNRLFESWEKQGVLLLNTSLTCRTGFPGSHQKIWDAFSHRLLHYISIENPGVNWFIWGDHALKATRNLKMQYYFVSKHPMMCYEKPERENDFLYGQNNCFNSLMHIIDWTGYSDDKGKKRQYELF
ncbi:MAG TPA: uracil-DNA glycosylase [Mariniphaga sp.]|nr:uracil-DNA glycosylase [Mariniphaga sp.]